MALGMVELTVESLVGDQHHITGGQVIGRDEGLLHTAIVLEEGGKEGGREGGKEGRRKGDRKSTRLNSSHG